LKIIGVDGYGCADFKGALDDEIIFERILVMDWI
jgi:hypothetical protein